ncbi:hypothetical protein GGS23DRAFT_608591 [Durotheca rogersii]|uniref:uncharacterized protein n=1 Tax=Durotheca rogersii TaxID=419775 RepID=UPI0022201034|nr:uncharacterized protein GGS23DRAFT_608591 [Durotheca rogersii]KAI5868031.1 hypothetical protein GGS23DRAFT_608591 [Durotheca rogersii]
MPPARGAASAERATALAQLQAVRPVLRGLAHRHRNQHGRAGWWWARFGMLRRHVAGVAGALQAAESGGGGGGGGARVAESGRVRRGCGDDGPGRVAKRRRRRGRGAGGGASRAAAGSSSSSVEARDHARWLLDVLVPRCYFAFSQLAADNQFAALGVVLLAALAQVRGACVSLCPAPPSLASSSPAAAAAAAAVPAPAGSVISREQAAALRPKRSRGSQAGGAAEGARPKKSKRKSRKSTGGDEFDALFRGMV